MSTRKIAPELQRKLFAFESCDSGGVCKWTRLCREVQEQSDTVHVIYDIITQSALESRAIREKCPVCFRSRDGCH